MVPALKYLQGHAADLGIDSAHLFYYATGALSGFLDNAPTAVTFHSLALGLVSQNPALADGATMIAGVPEIFLDAICVAAVFFGAMTYIGNGPNFMVKAIAESQDIKMPDFFSYMFKFSLVVLLPILIITQLIFY
jgi:Na+/H+ antiporter NhaD/arsenite permease-like protein